MLSSLELELLAPGTVLRCVEGDPSVDGEWTFLERVVQDGEPLLFCVRRVANGAPNAVEGSHFAEYAELELVTAPRRAGTVSAGLIRNIELALQSDAAVLAERDTNRWESIAISHLRDVLNEARPLAPGDRVTTASPPLLAFTGTVLEKPSWWNHVLHGGDPRSIYVVADGDELRSVLAYPPELVRMVESE